MIEEGALVYAKTIKNPQKPRKGARAHWSSLKAVGHFVTIVLGHAKPNSEPPTKTEAVRLLGNIGWVSLDDVEDFFGEKKNKEFIKYIQEKHK